MNNKNAILLHGTCDKEEYFNSQYPSLSNSHWFPWLQKQLIINGISTQTPEIPEAYSPNYAVWKQEFERYSINENTILVGHSCGGGFLVRWLSETDIKVNKVILVAPWLDPNRVKTTDFFNFKIDSKILERANSITIFTSENDESDILESVRLIKGSIPSIPVVSFKNHGHFTFEDMGSVEFTELLEEIKKQA